MVFILLFTFTNVHVFKLKYFCIIFFLFQTRLVVANILIDLLVV